MLTFDPMLSDGFFTATGAFKISPPLIYGGFFFFFFPAWTETSCLLVCLRSEIASKCSSLLEFHRFSTRRFSKPPAHYPMLHPRNEVTKHRTAAGSTTCVTLWVSFFKLIVGFVAMILVWCWFCCCIKGSVALLHSLPASFSSSLGIRLRTGTHDDEWNLGIEIKFVYNWWNKPLFLLAERQFRTRR